MQNTAATQVQWLLNSVLKVLERFRDETPDVDVFESGQCANLAFALERLCQEISSDLSLAHNAVSLTAIYRTTNEPDPLVTLSHVTLEFHDHAVYEDVDIGGNNASARWESRWDEEDCEFNYAELDVHECKRYGVPIDEPTICNYLAHLQSIWASIQAPQTQFRSDIRRGPACV